jgi:16S rRNA (cytidine1402-2'-O)-methyltransferase
MTSTGILYIVATPIGNLDDITLRAIETLKNADAVICEELREGQKLLKRLEIIPKELINLNEHNEAEKAMDLVIRMHQGERFALISDGGTPVFADPGHYLIRQASETGIPVVPIPGPSSLMAALSVLDFKLEKFIFGGFLARDPEERRQELQRLRGYRLPVVLMDTPYRLGSLLEDVIKTFGKGQAVVLAMDIALPEETILRGPVGEVRNRVGKRKAEFILIINPLNPHRSDAM